MIKHLFKLIWNRKRRTILLTIEILVSFLVLFVILSIFNSNYSKYFKPLGFEYKNLWCVKLTPLTADDSLKQVGGYMNIWDSMNGFPDIEEYCFSDNAPYFNSMSMNDFSNERDQHAPTFLFGVTDKFSDVLKLKLLEGRWFNEDDDAAGKQPVVITKSTRVALFGKDENVIGKSIWEMRREGKGDEFRIVGVVEDYRYFGEFETSPFNMSSFQGIFFRISKNNPHSNVTATINTDLMIKVKPGTGIAFEEKLINHIKNLTGGWTANIYNIEAQRDKYIESKVISIVLPGAIALFLIINVALGLLGVLWYSINRRRGEIGLRRAVGASGKNISRQIVGESLALGTFSILIGILFAAQFPILKLFDIEIVYYIIALICAALFLYLLISVCSFYPSVLASKIEPAEALHNE